MAAGLIIWLAAPHAGRYYADPGVSMFIAILIILSSFPLMRRAGMILLESVPTGVDMCDVQHDLERVSSSTSTILFLFLTTTRSRASTQSTNSTSGASTNKKLSPQCTLSCLKTRSRTL
ncbi:hypothetical protein ACN38_g10900 [Penicillium nordicum]|uniref:Uncharacterized protein n=1 Tax=Penicillium nordicum TaxID=229535 RepID=A0A0M9WBE8_9EURO|nr:hypothetical protein ACN38_g10900 [Penicillium nordicum]